MVQLVVEDVQLHRDLDSWDHEAARRAMSDIADCPDFETKVPATRARHSTSDLIGLSKFARICDWIMSRPQIQEEAIVMLADELERIVKPAGLAIVMEADHFCMHWRGVKDPDSIMTNLVMRGSFRDDAALRHEFLGLRKLDRT